MVEAAVDADTEHIRDGLGVVNDIPSPHKQTSKSSAKSKKRTTDRKRKGSSWYNVCSTDIIFLLLAFFAVYKCFV